MHSEILHQSSSDCWTQDILPSAACTRVAFFRSIHDNLSYPCTRALCRVNWLLFLPKGRVSCPLVLSLDWPCGLLWQIECGRNCLVNFQALTDLAVSSLCLLECWSHHIKKFRLTLGVTIAWLTHILNRAMWTCEATLHHSVPVEPPEDCGYRSEPKWDQDKNRSAELHPNCWSINIPTVVKQTSLYWEMKYSNRQNSCIS